MESFAVPSSILLLGLLLLTFFSAYFASSETAMMKLNPYKLRHLKDQGHGGAKRADKLLQRQDQLLGVILICNNLVNNCAALIAGVVCVRYFGDVGYGIAAVGLTIFFLIFAEIAPKTVAAERPEMIAYPSSWLLKPLLDVLRPLVLLVNWCSIGFVRPLLKSSDLSSQSLSIEELRTVLDSDVDNTVPNKDMLLALTYLQTNTVEDIMIPRDEIIGIDLTNPPDEIRTQILASRHTRHPIYRESLDNPIGLLHVRNAIKVLLDDDFTGEDLVDPAQAPYFVPDSTPLTSMLSQFRSDLNRMVFVVDEYGEVTGIVTLEDLVEEVVGEFPNSDSKRDKEAIKEEEDGGYVVAGSSQLRDINSHLNWSLPTERSKTLNGLILEHLTRIPDANVGLKINNYMIETLQISDAGIKTLKAWKLESPEQDDEENSDDD